MGADVFCDGCGKRNVTVEPCGIVKTVDYCETCKPQYLALQNEIDSLHTDLASQWESGLADLRENFKKEHPDWILPDEP